MSGKRNSDGTKRRTSNRSKPYTAEAAPRPVAPGYVRKDSGHMHGATDSIAEFVGLTFAKLGELMLTEVREQRAGTVERRPFHCHGNAEVDFGASYLFEIKGQHPEDDDFHAWLEDVRATEGVIKEATLDGLSEMVAERIATLAASVEQIVSTQIEDGLFYPFTTGCFVRVEEADLLIHFRLEQRPPRALPAFKPNRPDLS
jgi:hypothetical protein